MDKTYGFRLSAQDDDIRDKLEALASGERSKFIKDSIRFYISYEDKLLSITDSIKQIVSRMETGVGIPATMGAKETEPKDDQNGMTDHEKMVYDSIQDILNM